MTKPGSKQADPAGWTKLFLLCAASVKYWCVSLQKWPLLGAKPEQHTKLRVLLIYFLLSIFLPPSPHPFFITFLLFFYFLFFFFKKILELEVPMSRHRTHQGAASSQELVYRLDRAQALRPLTWDHTDWCTGERLWLGLEWPPLLERKGTGLWSLSGNK